MSVQYSTVQYNTVQYSTVQYSVGLSFYLEPTNRWMRAMFLCASQSSPPARYYEPVYVTRIFNILGFMEVGS